MRIFLAPMEGLIDFHIRELLTRLGGYDRCVTEFIRITDQKLPSRVFYKFCPELAMDGNQPFSTTLTSHTPVYIQLLGCHVQRLAENAQQAANLGAIGIDLNFGCPAKLVNKHSGGASLLKSPQKLFDIVHNVRLAVPSHIPVTAKIRLGYDDKNLCLDNAVAIEEAGAKELVIHARTKKDGYKPPAYWHDISPIREKLRIPVIANGEIWNYQDYVKCVRDSGCQDIMLGRGAISHPLLAKQIKNGNEDIDKKQEWKITCELLIEYHQRLSSHELHDKACCDRMKQWLSFFIKHQPQAHEIFHRVKRMTSSTDIIRQLKQSMLRTE